MTTQDLERLPKSGRIFAVANTLTHMVEASLKRHRPELGILGDRVYSLEGRGSLLAALPRDAQVPVIPFYVEPSEFRIGKPIDARKLRAIACPDDRIAYLEWRISLLAERGLFKQQTDRPLAGARRTDCCAPRPVAAPVPPDLLEREIAALGSQCRFAASGVLEVFLAPAGRIPKTIHEIGRLREIAFRAVGEGTGRGVDLDRFDARYLHLFVWNSTRREIVGGYRLAASSLGPEGLYTATLFQYGPEFLDRVGPALELGRSFVRLEYQRSFAPLLLLWKGIGRYVAANPGYKTLFGPVSISNQYSKLSRELMIAFLEKREWLAGLAGLVRPRRPPARRAAAELCRDLDDRSDIVSDLEPGAQGVPVLLRQYLRLGGKLLGFNVDQFFSEALDGLILVDLTKTEPRLLERYLGKTEAQTFLNHWKGFHGTL